MKVFPSILRLLTHFSQGKKSDKIFFILAILAIITIPFFTAKFIFHTHASSLNAITIEPETGTLAKGVSVVTDTNASGGKAVQFNQPNLAAVKNVFVILLENKDGSKIYGSANAPYINSLMTRSDGAYATNYRSVIPGETILGYLHPSEPNYIWLEGGTNSYSDMTFTTDSGASASNSTVSVDHLATLINNAGLNWRSYQEDIPGTSCPLSSSGNYAAKHNPFVFFKDVSNNNSTTSPYCISHVRPYTELARDLSATGSGVANYNFLTPNLQNDMHDGTIQQSDAWLQANLPVILNSPVYKNGGAIFITWDEDSGTTTNNPIGMIVLSPFAKGNGYNNALAYSHSSYVKTVENIFHLSPYLGHASDSATLDLSDLFVNGLPAPLAKAKANQSAQVAGASTIIAGASTKANNGAGNTTLTLSVPSPLSPGDVLLAQVVVNSASVIITPPAGWNTVVSTKSSSSLAMTTYYKVVTSTEPASYSWLLNSSQPASGGMTVYSGVDPNSPLDVSSGVYNASTATVTFKQVTTTTPNDMLVGLVGVSGNTSVTAPSGFLEQYDTNDTASTNGKTAESAIAIQVNTGLSSVPTAKDDTGSASNLAQLVALRPLVSGVTATPTQAVPSATATSVPTLGPTLIPSPICPQMPSTYAGSVTSTIQVPVDATYSLWGRLLGQDSASNAFYLQIDSNCPLKIGDLAGMPAHTWTWVNYQDGNPASLATATLTSGQHTLTLYAAEPNVQIDRLLFISDGSCIPQDNGDNCAPLDVPSLTPQLPSITPTPIIPSDTPFITPSVVPSMTPTPTPTPIVPSPTSIVSGGQNISVLGSTSANNGAKATTLQLNKPANLSTGNLMVAQIVVNASSTTITPPTGWSLVQNSKSGSSVEMSTYSKFVTSVEPLSYTFTFNSSQPASGGIVAFANVNAVTIVDAKSTKYNSNTKTVTFTQVNTTVANDMLMAVVGVSGNTSVILPAGFTTAYSVNDTLSGSGKTAAFGYSLKPTIGQTSVGTGSYAIAVSNLAQLIALKAQ